MSSFRNISHVDASELFQVGRIEDIKKIEEFLEIYTSNYSKCIYDKYAYACRYGL